MEYYWINSNEKHYKGAYKRWLRDGFAATYGSRERYGVLLDEFYPGDILFMYVKRTGIIAVGKVMERWDSRTHYTLDPDQKTDEKHEYRIPVSWEIILPEGDCVRCAEALDILDLKTYNIQATTVHLDRGLGEQLYNHIRRRDWRLESPEPKGANQS